MEGINKFNIRVYGILKKVDKVLFLKESYAGKKLMKLPGGGLEFGEGLADCLKREFKEELNLKITNVQHFYTQDFFVQSMFKENEQIQTIYFNVQVADYLDLTILDEGIDEVIWVPIDQWTNYPIELPIDKIVMEKYLKQFKKDH